MAHIWGRFVKSFELGLAHKFDGVAPPHASDGIAQLDKKKLKQVVADAATHATSHELHVDLVQQAMGELTAIVGRNVADALDNAITSASTQQTLQNLWANISLLETTSPTERETATFSSKKLIFLLVVMCAAASAYTLVSKGGVAVVSTTMTTARTRPRDLADGASAHALQIHGPVVLSKVPSDLV